MSLHRTFATFMVAFALTTVLTDNMHAQNGGKTIVVKMVDKSATEYVFEPAIIVASPGDVIRFEQLAAMPHNIEFRDVPAGADLGASKTSPMLTTPGQKFEFVVDKKYPKGIYSFVCVPHEAMGMKGKITVK